MALNFRIAAIGIAAVGLALGVAFGAGVAYGRGDPKTVESGLTAQQIQSMLGLSSAQASGGQATGSQAGGAATAQGTPAAGGGQQRAQGAAAGAGSVLGANMTAGRVTAVDGSTITIQTAQGSQKVTVGTSTSVSKITIGAIPDLTSGLTIFATGARKEDGSFEAASISQLPPELQAILAGGAAGQTRTP